MEENFDKTKLILPGAILIAALLVSGSVVFYSLNTGKLGQCKTGRRLGGRRKINVSADDDALWAMKNPSNDG